MKRVTAFFDSFARKVSAGAGQPAAFSLAALAILVWAALGPVEHFSNTWQLVINTGTTIVTFLMVFVLQHSQNRDTEAMRLKLDELIRAVSEADDELIGCEEWDDEQIARFRERNSRLAKLARASRRQAPGNEER
jgi:low affinity Fe/Cu permease